MSNLKSIGPGEQRYNGNGETVSFKRVEWLDKYVLTSDVFKKEESILDIGSGNGRVNSLYKKYFKKIVNVEPNSKLRDKFKFDNVEYFACDLENFEYDKKFNVIIFVFSLYLFEDKTSVFKKCLKYLKDNGRIIVITEVSWLDKESNPKLYIDLPKLCKKFNLSCNLKKRIHEEKLDYNYALVILKKTHNKVINTI